MEIFLTILIAILVLCVVGFFVIALCSKPFRDREEQIYRDEFNRVTKKTKQNHDNNQKV
jgi:hypothetical protein